MQKNLRGLRSLVSTLLILTAGCAADPATRAAGRPSANGFARTASLIFASVDEAAVAGLVAARESTPLAAREAIQIGTIRRVSGGYVYTRPAIADGSLSDARPSALRVRLMPDDVATYVVHPPTGAHDMDDRNEELNASEERLLGSAGRSRPVYLLTPRLEIVRHAIDERGFHLANIRSRRRALESGSRTALVD